MRLPRRFWPKWVECGAGWLARQCRGRLLRPAWSRIASDTVGIAKVTSIRGRYRKSGGETAEVAPRGFRLRYGARGRRTSGAHGKGLSAWRRAIPAMTSIICISRDSIRSQARLRRLHVQRYPARTVHRGSVWISSVRSAATSLTGSVFFHCDFGTSTDHSALAVSRKNAATPT